MSDTPTDMELLARIAGGDPNAIGELYDRHVSTLYPIALRIVRERAEAEDLIHDAFIAVNERAAQYVAERGSVIAWLVTLVRNLSIDRTRRRERRGTLAREVIAHEPPPTVPSPEALTAEAADR